MKPGLTAKVLRGVRWAAIRANSTLEEIHEGPDAHELLHANWTKLMKPIKNPTTIGLRPLMKVGGDTWFTQYPKQGERMDTWEPEFEVRTMEEMGAPVEFTTTVGGYHGFFKYGIKEVEAIAPPGAYGYTLAGEIQIISTGGNPTHHRVPIQFYKVDVDTSQRLIHVKELRDNYKKMMELLLVEK